MQACQLPDCPCAHGMQTLLRLSLPHPFGFPAANLEGPLPSVPRYSMLFSTSPEALYS